MKNYFRGWYIKCQNGNQTIALIPAYHLSNGERTCSIQLITDARSWNITFPEGSVMLSVADIPFCGFHFTGVISVVQFRGKEYRIATYLGARVAKLGDGEVVIKQGRRSLTARLLEAKGQALAAPAGGSMRRIIHESAACRASFSFRKGDKELLSFVSDRASFEYEYP